MNTIFEIFLALHIVGGAIGLLPLLLIIGSLILMILNIFLSSKMGLGFWMGNISSVLVIIAMLFTIRKKNSRNKPEL